MEIHPDAAIFPLMSADETAELASDIATHGLRNPLKTDHTGTLLVDGRNRETACTIANVEPRYEPLSADTDIFAYIISVNLHRRHLTDVQRREIVHQIAARNPTISNRQIAKLAGVNRSTVDRVLNGSRGASAPRNPKVIGADGKAYPAAGNNISPEKESR